MKAGVAVQEISPQGNIALFGHPRIRREMSGVHDPLLVSALHIRTDAVGVVIISLDLFALEPYTCSQICDLVADATATPRDRVFVGCTHTHSGPTTVWSYPWRNDTTVPTPDVGYVETVKHAAVLAAASACATTRPIELASTTIRHPDADGNGAIETDVLALRETGTGTYAAVILACGILPATVDPDSSLLSADFPHFVREQLMQRFGRQLVVLHFTAPCVGQNPSYFSGADPFAKAQSVGTGLGRSVIEALHGASWSSFPGVEVNMLRKEIATGPFRDMPSVEAAEAAAADKRARLDRLTKEGSDRNAWWRATADAAQAEAICTLAQQQRDGIFDQIRFMYGTAELRIMRMGDIMLVGLPGNHDPECASRLKKQGKGRFRWRLM